jgi:Acyl-CoA dehydrogenase, C-terminal domain
MDGADRELLATTVSQALTTHRHRNGDDMLAELGWYDMLAADTLDAIAVVFNELGAACIASSCLSDVVAHGLGLPSGSRVVLPSYGSSAPPGTIVGSRVVVDGTTIGADDDSDTLTVACTTDEIVTVHRADLEVIPHSGTDSTLRVASVSGEAAATFQAPDGTWSEATDLARIALAHEVTAASRTMLMLATTHARDRMQFGRPIASFQAVRHKLAEVLVAIEAAEATIDAAHDVPSSTTALLANVLAGRAASIAGEHSQQVLAGIGFTREHELHHFLLRTITLDGVFSSTATLTRELGAELLATGSVPRVIEL